jgi:hypothetical protein
MKPDPARAERENTARFVFAALQKLPHPSDAAAVLATVHAALIWTQRAKDEKAVREIMSKLADITVEAWKVQRAAAAEARENQHG